MLKKINLYILLAIPAVLLFVYYDMFFPFISGKNLLFRFLVEISFGLYLFLIFKDKELRPRKSSVLVALSVFLFVVFLADAFSPNFLKAFWSNFERMEGLVAIIHLGLYFVMLGSLLNTSRLWDKFFAGFLCVSSALNIFGWLQYIGGAQINQGASRVDSLMGNSAYFAGFLMFQVFVLLFLIKREFNNPKFFAWIVFVGSTLFSIVYIFGSVKSISGRWMTFLSLLISGLILFLSYILKNRNARILTFILFSTILISHTVLIYLTQTRGAALGLIGGIFLTSLIIAIKERRKKIRLVGISVCVALLMIVFGFILIRNTDFVKNSPVLSRFAQISWSERKTQARQIIWPMAFKGVAERPILGWGQEGFNYVFANHYDVALIKHEPWFDRTHNVFLDWFVASGLLGFLSYLSLYFIALVVIVKKIFPRSVTEGSILIGLISAYSFQNMFIFDNLGSYISFFAFLAFIHFESKNELRESNHREKNKDDEVSPAFVAIGSAVLVVLSVYFMIYTPFIQNTNIIKGLSPQKKGPEENLRIFKETFAYGGIGLDEAREHFFKVAREIIGVENLDMNVKLDFFNEATKQAEMQIKDVPLESKPFLISGLFFGQVGQLDTALKYLDIALKNAPNKIQIINQVALIYILKNDPSNSLVYAERSYNLDTSFDDSVMVYASALFLNNRRDEAISILKDKAEEGIIPAKFLSDAMITNGLKTQLKQIVEVAYKANPSEENKNLLEGLTK